MKQIKMILTAVAIFAVVGGALAFKSSAFGARNVYCLAAGDVSGVCPASAIVNFKLDANGSVINPCPAGITEHIQNGSNCQDVSAALPKISPAFGSN